VCRTLSSVRIRLDRPRPFCARPPALRRTMKTPHRQHRAPFTSSTRKSGRADPSKSASHVGHGIDRDARLATRRKHARMIESSRVRARDRMRPRVPLARARLRVINALLSAAARSCILAQHRPWPLHITSSHSGPRRNGAMPAVKPRLPAFFFPRKKKKKKNPRGLAV